MAEPETTKPLDPMRATMADRPAHRAVNAALQQSEDRYRALVEIAPIGIAVHVAGRLVFANPEVARIVGAPSPEALLGREMVELIHPDDRAEAKARMRCVLEERKPTQLQPFRFVRLSGETVWVEVGGTPITHAGTPASQVVMLDIDERKKKELELTELRMAVETSGEVVFLTDREGQFLYVNPEFTRVYGWSAADVVGRATPRILKSGLIGEHQYAKFWRTILEGGVLRGEFKNRTKDAKNIDVDSSVSPIFDDKKQLIGFLAVQRDITARKRAEAQLRTTQYSVDHAPDAVLWADPSGQIVYGNQKLESLLGYSGAELEKLNLWDVEPAASPELWRESWQRLKQEGSWTTESALMSKEGKLIPVEICGNLGVIEGNELYFAFLRDITERKSLTEQLQQAQKMEAIGRLAGGVAHDFNNILSVILTYASLALEELQPSDPLWADIDEIEKAARRAAGVARQLLVFSRREPVMPTLTDLNDVLAGMEKLLGRLLGEHVRLRTIPGVNLWPVRIDVGQLEQAVVNLAVNARDAMPDGGELILTTANVEVSPNNSGRESMMPAVPFVRLEVRDTGHGMTPEILSHLFEPFFTTKPKGLGTGLGLSLVYGIVKRAGGDVRVVSSKDAGATFIIDLPAEQGVIADRTPIAPPQAQPGADQRILLVEDDDAVRILATRVLARAGYHVIDATNAGEALLAAEQSKEPIDLLLTDVVMPRMSGPDLADRLTALHPELAVLFMTGYAGENTSRVEAAGDKGLLRKPFTRETLLEAVSRILDGGTASLRAPRP